MKEVVDKIQKIRWVSVHFPGPDIISIGNGSSFNPRINVKEISSISEEKRPNGEPAIKLSFISGQSLFITERDFAFTVMQNGNVVIDKFPNVVTIGEVIRHLDSFAEVVRNPNLDTVEAAFYQVYYMLDSAAYFRFDLDRAISRFHACAKDLHFFEREKLPLFNCFYIGNRGLNLQKLKMEDCYDIVDFINFWKGFYAYGRKEKYILIHNKELEKDDLIALYEWKNGMDNLSSKKQKSLEGKILCKIDLINELRRSEKFDLEAFLNEFKSVSVVWKIFLLHIVKPNNYPIYDQHVHRAYQYMSSKDFDKIGSSMSEKKKLNFYLYEYLPFVNRMEIKNLKEMDEAFFAFGQFLNINNQKELLEA